MTGLDAVPPAQLGKWLQHARKASGKSQEQVAEFLGVARTTITAMEKGERRVKPAELARLAQLYGRQVAELLRPGEPDEAFALQLRAAIAPHEEVAPDLEPAARAFQSLCEDYLELERLTSSALLKRYPPERPLPRTQVEQVAEDMAVEERLRLGLGDGPVTNVRQVLENDLGARVFLIPMPSRVAGMFAYTERVGPCIAVNVKQPNERRRMTMVHEWAHFLTARYQPEVEVAHRFEREPALERFANAFSRSFLMPAAGLSRRLNEIKWGRGQSKGGAAAKPTVADLLTLADYFAVSFETLTRRLEELRLITIGTMDALRRQQFAVREARTILGLHDRPVSDQMLPSRYIFLAVGAYREGTLSEGRLARFLRVDRVQARAIVQGVTEP